jgi:hypothetical protein
MSRWMDLGVKCWNWTILWNGFIDRNSKAAHCLSIWDLYQ